MSTKITKAALLTLFCLGAISFPVQAEKIKNDPEVRKESAESVKQQKDEMTKIKINVDKDVNNGLDKVSEAIKTLDEGKPEKALELLREAVGSFDIALAADPDLDLVPVDSVVHLHELYTTPKLVKRQVALAEDLLEDGKVQAARKLLMSLQSDITETVTYLPMATYPDAIRAAVKEIANGKIEKAKETLAIAMSTLVVANTKVVPIPLVTARALIEDASKLDKEKKKDEIKTKLTRAKDQLELARILGYQTKGSKEYKKIKKDIEKIEEEIEGKNKVEELYSDLKVYFSHWIDRISKPFFPKGAKQETKDG